MPNEEMGTSSQKKTKLSLEGKESELILLAWLKKVKFGGYLEFKIKDGIIHSDEGGDDDKDFSFAVEYANLARQKNFTYEQMQEYVSSLSDKNKK